MYAATTKDEGTAQMGVFNSLFFIDGGARRANHLRGGLILQEIALNL
jgi:hypothetical protein